MNDILSSKLSIRRITRDNDNDYAEALHIYNTTTPIEIKTNSNEITSVLSSDLPCVTFELMIFAIYYNDEIIGMAMLINVPGNRVAIYDYVALKESYRLNAVYFMVINLLQNYFSEYNVNVDYFVVEINNRLNGEGMDRESRFFKKLICLEGFGKIVNINYHTAPIGIDNHEGEFPAFLYVKTNGIIRQISKETLVIIIESIYFDYYAAWYSLFLTSNKYASYKLKLDNSMKAIIDHLQDTTSFDIEYADCPLLDFHPVIPRLKPNIIKNKQKCAVILLILLITPIAIVYLYTVALDSLGIPLSSASSILGGIFGAILSSFTAFYISRRKS